MAENSKIEWCDATVNFWWGCEKVHAGCTNCYAEAWSKRFGRKLWGPGSVRLKMKNAIATAHKLNRQAEKLGRPLLVFSQSMADMLEDFHGEVVDKNGVVLGDNLNVLRDEAFECIDGCQNLIWLVLTKRPERAHAVLSKHLLQRLPNLWLGTSPCNQETADKSIPELLKVSDLCGGTFLSCEPLLGAIRLAPLWNHGNFDPDFDVGIDWVIAGGESGPGARPCHPDWARGLRDQCQSAGVPFFWKQWGEWGTRAINLATNEPVFREFTDFNHWVAKASTWVRGGVCIDATGRLLANGADFQRAQSEGTFPVTIMHKVGKSAAGRQLDGREWSEFPEAFQRSPSPATSSREGSDE